MKLHRVRRLLVACTCLVAVAALGATTLPAYAAPGDQENLAAQYTSLSGALVAFYAEQEGLTIAQYVQDSGTLLGQPLPEMPELPVVDSNSSLHPAPPTSSDVETTAPVEVPGTTPVVDSPSSTLTAPEPPVTSGLDSNAALAQLNAQLAQSGLTLDTSKYQSLNDIAADVNAKSTTIDGAVTLAAANWIANLSQLRAPKLTTPSAVTPGMPGVPQDALAFGLLNTNAISTLIADQPDLFANVSSSGLGNKAFNQAWKDALAKAYSNSKVDLDRALPSPCTGAMLAIMATGDAGAGQSYGNCADGCVAGGIYLNNLSSGLFLPGGSSALGNPMSDVWNAATVQGLQKWQQQLLAEQNPMITQDLSYDNAQQSKACAAASEATQNTLDETLPGIFGSMSTAK